MPMLMSKFLLKVALIAHKTAKFAPRSLSDKLNDISLSLTLKAASRAKPKGRWKCKCHG